MSGYTPLFQSLTTGTLCGRWPDIGLWPIVLSLADKHGVVDVTPAYIAGVTGLPLPDVIACMKRFCEPDPESRWPDDDGARLVVIGSRREFGWKVVGWPRTGEFDFRQASRPGQSAWAEIRRLIFERDGYVCRYCGVRGGRLECDHVLAVSRGGGHTPENLVTACFTCNRSKRAKSVEEWNRDRASA